MIIAPIMRGERESSDHLIQASAEEISQIIVAMDEYCQNNKRKKKAKKILKQFEDEAQIY